MSSVHIAARTLTSMAVLAMALTTACDTSESFSAASCDVLLEQLKPSSATPGDEVTALGRPFSSAYDTAVYVGSARATILALERDRCDPCDDCLEDEACTGCDDCDACDWLCSQCFETVRFELPDVQAGDTVVTLFNRHGTSNGLPLEVLGTTADTGPSDTDTGTSDSSPQDTDPIDTDNPDTSPTDTAPSDTAPEETGASDTSATDTAS